MKISVPHPWRVDNRTAVSIQEWLRGRVVCSLPRDTEMRVTCFSSINISLTDGWPPKFRITSDTYTWPEVELYSSIERVGSGAIWPPDTEIFSYGELLCDLLKENEQVDMMIVNRPGVCHPRYFGPASHIGIITELPTISITRELEYGYLEGLKIMCDETTYVPSEESIEAAKKLEFNINLSTKTYGGIVGAKLPDSHHIVIGHMSTPGEAKYIVNRLSEVVPLSSIITGGPLWNYDVST